jgi:hypothetical protein
MSPEYAMDGLFSMKSDVYSLGVIVLEIVTGKKNRGFYDPELDLTLLGYVSSSKARLALLKCSQETILNFSIFARLICYGKEAGARN